MWELLALDMGCVNGLSGYGGSAGINPMYEWAIGSVSEWYELLSSWLWLVWYIQPATLVTEVIGASAHHTAAAWSRLEIFSGFVSTGRRKSNFTLWIFGNFCPNFRNLADISLYLADISHFQPLFCHFSEIFADLWHQKLFVAPRREKLPFWAGFSREFPRFSPEIGRRKLIRPRNSSLRARNPDFQGLK